MDETILTLAELKAYLGIAADDATQDTELGALLSVLPAWLYDITGTWFGSTKEVTEVQDYAPVVFVDNWPVTAVSNVYIGTLRAGMTLSDLYEDTSFTWSDTGRITLTTGSYNHITERKDYDQVHVKYTYGVATVPEPVKQAAKIMLKSLWVSDQNGGTEVSSEQVGSYRKTYKQTNKEQILLAPYLRVRV